jgi:hypothetical protein
MPTGNLPRVAAARALEKLARQERRFDQNAPTYRSFAMRLGHNCCSKKYVDDTIERLQPAARHPILVMSLGTMNINALVISGSDPGAVPGDSTNHPFIWGAFIWGSWGRNRIDERLKVLALFRLSATVIGETCTIANDNRAPMALAA